MYSAQHRQTSGLHYHEYLCVGPNARPALQVRPLFLEDLTVVTIATSNKVTACYACICFTVAAPENNNAMQLQQLRQLQMQQLQMNGLRIQMWHLFSMHFNRSTYSAQFHHPPFVSIRKKKKPPPCVCLSTKPLNRGARYATNAAAHAAATEAKFFEPRVIALSEGS